MAEFARVCEDRGVDVELPRDAGQGEVQAAVRELMVRRLRQPCLRPLRAAAGNRSVKVMESKVKKRNKKGADAGSLPAAIDLEIWEAEEYLTTDVQLLHIIQCSGLHGFCAFSWSCNRSMAQYSSPSEPRRHLELSQNKTPSSSSRCPHRGSVGPAPPRHGARLRALGISSGVMHLHLQEKKNAGVKFACWATIIRPDGGGDDLEAWATIWKQDRRR